MPGQTDHGPIVDDFRIEARDSETFGVQMVWLSEARGELTAFPWWDHLERPDSRLDEPEWGRLWTRSDPYLDADQDWALRLFVDDGYVVVASGPGFDDLATYRVPVVDFRRAMDQFLRRVRGS